jgi:hypothetical protein
MRGGIRAITCEITEQKVRAIPDIWNDRRHGIYFILALNAVILLNESACDLIGRLNFESLLH